MGEKFVYIVGLAVMCVSLLLAPSVMAASVVVGDVHGRMEVVSWKALRDHRIIKQNLDYSCGAASLATVLSSFYGLNVTEKDVLDAMEQDGEASFADLAKVSHKYGFKAEGFALSFATLKGLKIPAIAYVRHRGNDHFSVIRGIGDDDAVHLGDPSLGNEYVSRYKFLKMWETRNDPNARGKILVIIPKDQSLVTMDRLFFGKPRRLGINIDDVSAYNYVNVIRDE